MPYIVTTGQREPMLAGHEQRIDPATASRRAVATLEEAYPYLAGLLSALIPWPSNPEASHAAAAWIRSVTQDEVFAPFTTPDGTAIEVESVGWAGIMSAVDIQMGDYDGALARFNARQHP